jgi:hypothetical protein
MKKLIILLTIATFTLASIQTKAQAFDENTKLITLSLGGADMFHIPAGYAYYTGFYAPITGQFAIEGEFAVHRYVGIGFNAGFGGRAGNYGYHGGPGAGYYGYGYGYRSEFNINAGFIANFHFYQLIADKTHKNLHADKLDIYAGLSTGGGVAVHPSDPYFPNTNIDGLFYIGPQVGIHYFFNGVVGINGEFGFGKNLARVGVTFKLGGTKTAKK